MSRWSTFGYMVLAVIVGIGLTILVLTLVASGVGHDDLSLRIDELERQNAEIRCLVIEGNDAAAIAECGTVDPIGWTP